MQHNQNDQTAISWDQITREDILALSATELVKLLESNVGKFRTDYGYLDLDEKTIRKSESIPSANKPATQFLQALGANIDLRDHWNPANPPKKTKPKSGHSIKGMIEYLPKDIEIFDFRVPINQRNDHTKKLIIDKKIPQEILDSFSIHINTDLFPEGTYIEMCEQFRKGKTRHPANGELLANLATQICIAQKYVSFVEQKIMLDGTAVLIPRNEKVTRINGWQLSIPALDFKVNGYARELSPRKAKAFIEGMYSSLFSTSKKLGLTHICLTPAGLGVFGGKEEDYYNAVIKIAKLYPELIIIYNPGQNRALFDHMLKNCGSEIKNLSTTNKDVYFLFLELEKKGIRCAIHSPADADPMYGYRDIGQFWVCGRGQGYVGEEHQGSMGSAPTCGQGLFPEGYTNRVYELNLGFESPEETAKKTLLLNQLEEAISFLEVKEVLGVTESHVFNPEYFKKDLHDCFQRIKESGKLLDLHVIGETLHFILSMRQSPKFSVEKIRHFYPEASGSKHSDTTRFISNIIALLWFDGQKKNEKISSCINPIKQIVNQEEYKEFSITKYIHVLNHEIKAKDPVERFALLVKSCVQEGLFERNDIDQQACYFLIAKHISEYAKSLGIKCPFNLQDPNESENLSLALKNYCRDVNRYSEHMDEAVKTYFDVYTQPNKYVMSTSTTSTSTAVSTSSIFSEGKAPVEENVEEDKSIEEEGEKAREKRLKNKSPEDSPRQLTAEKKMRKLT